MNQQLRATQVNQNKTKDKAFYTELNEKNEIEDNQGKLRKYVDHMDKKIDYAKWKQDLVLKYNYMPMKRMTEKVQNEKMNYLKKISDEEKNCAKILSGKEITVQLDLFRQFSIKLNEKMQQYQVRIADQKMKNDILSKEVTQKRDRLKGKMRQNMEIIKLNLEKQGIVTKQDIITLVRSHSTKDRFNPTAISFISNTQTVRKSTPRKTTSEQTKRTLIKNSNKLFQQCFSKLINEIQTMRSSQDIQSGIYLDIMDRSDKGNYKTQGRYAKSKISETLHAKFGSGQIQQLKNAKNKANFEMDWETFKQLNWKQIMGILLVKDKNCQKMKKLLIFT